jgi:hypothetical protein
MGRERRSISAVWIVSAVLATAMGGGCARPSVLPDSTSVAAKLYVSRCSTCHRPYDPRSMTAVMWQIQMPVMETRIARAGLPPLTADERASILDYLTRNAGHE